MKKTLFVLSALLVTGTLLAGGLVTNTNQSAKYIRLLSRNASTDIDAVYYNPAGLTRLAPGFHFGINNQTIGQRRSVMTTYPYLHGAPDREFVGTVSAPFYPNIYAAYNTGRMAFSLGFNPVGGGGGATYDEGLAMIEIPISDLVPLLAPQGAQDYRLETNFIGSSIFYGFQGNVSYKINDILSVSAGARYVMARNTYEGKMEKIELNMGGTWLPASTVFTNVATQLAGIVAIPSNVQPIIDGGGGDFTLAQLEAAGYIDAVQRAGIEAGLAAIGVPSSNIPVMTLNQISGTITGATPALNTQIASATATSSLMHDQKADVLQTGSGITPIIGVNLTLADIVNIGIKYEFATKLRVINETTSDFTTGIDPSTGAPITMFPDGAETINDMPAMLAVGVEVRPMERFMLTGSVNYYFDKPIDYDGSADRDVNMIDKNFLEYAFGLEFGFTKNIFASVAYSGTSTGVNLNYQDELSYSLNTSTFGGGLGFHITPMIDLNLGGMYTIYQEGSKNTSRPMTGMSSVSVPFTETYNKNNWILAVGVDLHF
jgi:long-subunit fatty acid transport protein